MQLSDGMDSRSPGGNLMQGNQAQRSSGLNIVDATSGRGQTRIGTTA